MALEIKNDGMNNLVEVRVTGKLVAEDYDKFVPTIEELIRQKGKLRIFFEMIDFHGWSLSALWEDVKFDLKHFRDIERLAVVGDKKWEEGMTVFCKPFTTAQVKYFDHAHREEALAWLATNETADARA